MGKNMFAVAIYLWQQNFAILTNVSNYSFIIMYWAEITLFAKWFTNLVKYYISFSIQLKLIGNYTFIYLIF